MMEVGIRIGGQEVPEYAFLKCKAVSGTRRTAGFGYLVTHYRELFILG